LFFVFCFFDLIVRVQVRARAHVPLDGANVALVPLADLVGLCFDWLLP